MPEVKRSFLKSKMNQDLDDRLIPEGEYREGNNISINRSEGQDVGALENILGNRIITDFGLSSDCALEAIGVYTDAVTNRMFVFLTNYTDTSSNKLDNNTCMGFVNTVTSTINCYIAVYDTSTDTYNILTSGYYLNFSKTHPVYGINIIENLLFWTDNRNQPRRLNVETAIANPDYYYMEEHISVAKYYPFQPISLLDGTGSGYESTMKDVVNDTLGNAITANPFYDAVWDGDTDFLRDKFVRFSYRFKYDDNEYSLMAPFTQICFVPEQDGYFRDRASGLGQQLKEDLQTAYESTELTWFRNKINQIVLRIPAPTNGSTGLTDMGKWDKAGDYFKVKEIEILYKESNKLAIQVVEIITSDEIASAGSVSHYEYTYKSKRPFKTLPGSETTRVSDVVPIRALAQETSGNRIIYGNFIDKPSPPQSLNYGSSVGIKGGSTMLPSAGVDPTGARKEYQNHTLKQNRTYQVGVILSDLYGRQSSVIPASVDGANIIHHDYKGSSWTPGVITADDTWPGDQLSIAFGEEIPDVSTIQGYPGIYIPASDAQQIHPENPLGWFSYKIVVKQQEQDYYNVYFPGILNGYRLPIPPGPVNANLQNPYGYIVLHGDNINKIPKDTMNVGPGQNIFRSVSMTEAEEKEWFLKWWYEAKAAGVNVEDVGIQAQALEEHTNRLYLERLADSENTSIVLFGRVENYSSTDTRQWYPKESGKRVKNDNVVLIGKLTDLGQADTVMTGSHLDAPEFYDAVSDPMIAKLQLTAVGSSNDFPGYGANSSPGMTPILSVYETAPTESKIDLYWETTTSGIISTLNTDIRYNDNTSVQAWWGSFSSTPRLSLLPAPAWWTEAAGPGSFVIYQFQPYNYNAISPGVGNTLSCTAMTLLSAVDGYGNDFTSKFELTFDPGAADGTPVTNGSATIKTSAGSYFWYRSDSLLNTIYFNVECTIGGVKSSRILGDTSGNASGPSTGMPLQNANPVVTIPSVPETVVGTISGGYLFACKGKNGSLDPNNDLKEVTWSIASAAIAGGGAVVTYFYAVTSSLEGVVNVYNSTNTPAGSYEIIMRITDNGGLIAHAPIVTVNVS